MNLTWALQNLPSLMFMSQETKKSGITGTSQVDNPRATPSLNCTAQIDVSPATLYTRGTQEIQVSILARQNMVASFTVGTKLFPARLPLEIRRILQDWLLASRAPKLLGFQVYGASSPTQV